VETINSKLGDASMYDACAQGLTDWLGIDDWWQGLSDTDLSNLSSHFPKLLDELTGNMEEAIGLLHRFCLTTWASDFSIAIKDSNEVAAFLSGDAVKTHKKDLQPLFQLLSKAEVAADAATTNMRFVMKWYDNIDNIVTLLQGGAMEHQGLLDLQELANVFDQHESMKGVIELAVLQGVRDWWQLPTLMPLVVAKLGALEGLPTTRVKEALVKILALESILRREHPALANEDLAKLRLGSEVNVDSDLAVLKTSAISKQSGPLASKVDGMRRVLKIMDCAVRVDLVLADASVSDPAFLTAATNLQCWSMGKLDTKAASLEDAQMHDAVSQTIQASMTRITHVANAHLEDLIEKARSYAPASLVIDDPNILTSERKQALVLNNPNHLKLVDLQIHISQAIDLATKLTQHGYKVSDDIQTDLGKTKTYSKQCLGVQYVLRELSDNKPNDPAAAKKLGTELLSCLKKKGNGKTWSLPKAIQDLLVRMKD
jgi:hypothetical protein